MYKIWVRNHLKSEVIGRCGADDKTNDHAELAKDGRLKKRRALTKELVFIHTFCDLFVPLLYV